MVSVQLVLVLVAAAYLVAYLGRLLVRHVLHVRRVDKVSASIPGPPTYPLVGSFLEVAGPTRQLPRILDSLVGRYGTLFKLWCGPVPVAIMLDPDDLQVLFNHPHLADKSSLYKIMEPVIGRGLITMNGPVYKRHRKAITTSLHLEILHDFMHSFNSNTRKLLARFDEKAASGEVFDAIPMLGWNSSHSVCETVLASEAPGVEAEKKAFVHSVHMSGRVTLYRTMRPWYASDFIFSFSKKQYKIYNDVVRGMSSAAKKLLDRKMDQIKQGIRAPRTTRRQTFLDHVLTTEEGAKLNKDELLQELQTLMFAGSTTSMDLQSFFLLCMALRPEVQRKIQKELDDVFGQEMDRDVLSTDLPHLQYLEATIKETLRCYPVIPIYARQASGDVPLPSGHVIPKGMHVVVLPVQVHRNAKAFPDPLTYNPDRFLPENSAGRHPFAFVPFSAGTRNCIGQRYAMMFAKTVLASMLRRYEILPDPNGPQRLEDIKVESGIALSVKGGANIRLRARRPNFPVAKAGGDAETVAVAG